VRALLLVEVVQGLTRLVPLQQQQQKSGLLLALIAVDNTDQAMYNSLMLALLVVLAAMLFAVFAVGLTAFSRLLYIVDHASPSHAARLGNMRSAVIRMRNYLLLTLPIIIAAFVIAVILHGALGSIPFVWVVVELLVAVVFPVIATAGVYRFVGRGSKRKDKTQTATVSFTQPANLNNSTRNDTRHRVAGTSETTTQSTPAPDMSLRLTKVPKYFRRARNVQLQRQLSTVQSSREEPAV